MNILIENEQGNVINVSRASIMVVGSDLVGLYENRESVLIQRYESKLEAEREIRALKGEIKARVRIGQSEMYYETKKKKVGEEEEDGRN